MRGRRLASLPVLALVVGLGCAAAAPAARAAGQPPPAEVPPPLERPELLPLPEPALDAAEEAVRRQLETQREALAELEGRGAPEPPELAEAFGRMGQLYLLYGFEEAALPAFENARRLAPEDFRWSYYRGVLAERSGDFETAADAFERALELAPGDLPTLLRLGRIALEDHRPDDAEACYREALERGAGAAAVYGLGRVALERGEHERAVERFREVLESHPDAASVHYQLGLAYRGLGELERAREHLAHHGGDRFGFPDPLVDGLALLSTGAGAHMDRGNRAMALGDPEGAVPHYRRAVEEAPPENLQPSRALASALARAGRAEEALELYRDLLERDPDDPVSRFNLANLYVDRGELETAERHFRRAVEIAPDYADAHFNLALVLEQLGRVEEAAEQARRAVTADPEGLEPKRLLADLLLRSGRLEDAREAVELAPGMAEAHRTLASALGRAGRFEEAAGRYGRAAELEPGDEASHFGRATALLLAGREAEAREALEASVLRFSESLPLRHALARLLAAGEDPEVRDGHRALELAAEVFRSYPSVEHGQTLAMAHAELGRFEEAVAWQRRILQRAESVGRDEILPELREQLESYLEGEPVRAPWRQSATGER